MAFWRWFDIARLRWRSVLRRRRVEQDLDRELQFFVEQEAAHLVNKGMSVEEARYAARRALGGYTQIQEECRDMRRTNHLEDLVRDLRYAARSFLRDPGFTLAIVLSMALSIGATSSIFSLIDGVLLRALPYRDPGQLVRTFLNSSSYSKFPVNPNDFRDFRQQNHTFESMAAYTRTDNQLSGNGKPVRLSSFAVTAGFFHVLGLTPAMGREFSEADEVSGGANVVVLSDRLWRSQFGASRDVVGRRIWLEAIPFTVTGVMPPGAEHPGNTYRAVAFGDTVDLWTAFKFEGSPERRGSHFLDCIGRMKPGITQRQAEADLNAVMAELARTHEGDRNWRIFLVPLHREIVAGSRPLLLVLLGAVTLVLLIACANAANLLLARASSRRREIALRLAVGAGRMRLVRQMLAESLLLSCMGAVLGGLLAVGGVKVLVALLPADFPRAADIHVNGMLFLFTIVVALATGVAFGLAPALSASRTDLREPLHESSRSATSGGDSLRLRHLLVVGEVALACVLLIGAALMMRSFSNLLHDDFGFKAEHALTATLSLPEATYKDEKSASLFYKRLLDELESDPEIAVAGIGSDLPWTGYDDNAGGFKIEGKTPPPHQEFHARYHMASNDYFRALRVPLVAGRYFNEHDVRGSQNVVLINRSMALKYWPGEDAAGKRMTFADKPEDKDWLTVVGVVGDVKDTPSSAAAEPAFWWPVAQAPFEPEMVAVLRGRSDPNALGAKLRAAVAALDPNLAVGDVRFLDDVAGHSFSAPRFGLFLVGLFAALALALAAVGTYGVISYSVNQRKQEFGIRMALGAGAFNVIGFVLREGMKLAAAGTAVGIVCGLGMSRALGSLLYRVKPFDPFTLGLCAVVVLGTAALACYVPARRATSSDPMTALRAD